LVADHEDESPGSKVLREGEPSGEPGAAWDAGSPEGSPSRATQPPSVRPRRGPETITFDGTFPTWRAHARHLLATGARPERVAWHDTSDAAAAQAGLFSAAAEPTPLPPADPDTPPPKVNKAFPAIAEHVALHRDIDAKWPLLYRCLWRLTRPVSRGGEPHLLSLASDPDVVRLTQMRHAVKRDAHKMHAFVRFREVKEENGAVRYVAFHRPDHLIVPREAAWFKRRFPTMAFSLLTPDRCAHWDPASQELTFGPGVDASAAAEPDDIESLWLTYYANIFNPARIKMSAMLNEMPRRYWKTMPETKLIPAMLDDAPRRLAEMEKYSLKNADSAAVHLPAGDGPFALPQLAAAAEECRGCDLCGPATQVVFGRGPQHARVVLVGEQPGDREDRAGEPFIGPAGQKLDELLARAGVDREACYVTNAVKHFRFEPRGKRRIHAKPSARHVTACRPWLEAELESIRPRVVVALGATAARALLGSTFKITRERGAFRPTQWCERTIATYHPSALLRVPDRERAAAMEAEMLADLVKVATVV